MNSNGFVISTEGLSKSFGEVHALKSLDLRVPQKLIFAFLDPNGAGKTTTITLMLKPFTGHIHPYLLGKICNTFCITEVPPRDKA